MKKSKKAKIGIIGCGNMGRAIAERIKSIFKTVIFDKDAAKTRNITKVITAPNLTELVNIADVVILAIKPQDFNEVLGEIKNSIDNKLVISIAAGISTKYIEKILGKARVIRVMPNLLVKIGEGVTALCNGEFATADDLGLAQEIFDKVGTTIVLEEKMMDADTAFLGSGPGFHFDLLSRIEKERWPEFTENEFIPSFAASGEKVGFSREQAKLFAELIAKGDLVLLEELNESPGALCIRVTSKGGTTEAGLKELKGDVERLPNAVEAARKRAEELSNEAATFQAKRRRKVA
ncbi:MAG: pyrroline-5-carboxylate reductase [Candidatus Omnitrophica bacterium]|jgi:pyrroline-5-carboxylate reductase|nr:pyrroline-5-carboxylate reductase [Candidatus Omnitrophota bacterium]